MYLRPQKKNGMLSNVYQTTKVYKNVRDDRITGSTKNVERMVGLVKCIIIVISVLLLINRTAVCMQK